MKEMNDRQRRSIFYNILITCIATTMMSTALTTALPPIIKELNISAATGQWLSSGYYLCMGIMIPITAYLITNFRTDKLYESALLLFIVGLVLCVIARSFPLLMLGRVLQAAANGILSSMGQVVLLSIFPADKKGSVMGWYGLSLGAAPVLAPTLAGVLVDHFSWRILFVIPLIVMVLSFVCAKFVFSDILPVKKKPFDTLSCAMSLVAFGGVTLGAGNAGTYGWQSLPVLLPLALGAVTAVFFVKRQLRREDPFLELRVFSNRQFTMGVLGSMALYLITMTSTIVMPMYIQSMKGYSATVSGLATLPGSIVVAVVSPFAGKIYDRIGMKKLLLIGTASCLVANVGMLFVDISTSIAAAIILNAARQLTVGLLLMIFVAWGTEQLAGTEVTHGTVLITSLRTVAGSLGMSISIGVMTQVSNATRRAGETFTIQGLHGAFVFLTCVTMILVCITAAVVFEERGGQKAEKKPA